MIMMKMMIMIIIIMIIIITTTTITIVPVSKECETCPPRSHELVKKNISRKRQNKKEEEEEVQNYSFLPRGALSNPWVERIATLRGDLDKILSGSGPSLKKNVTGPGPMPELESRRYEAAKLLTQLMTERQRLRRSPSIGTAIGRRRRRSIQRRGRRRRNHQTSG